MSTKLQFKEDSIQLIEISDQSSSITSGGSKFKKRNKVATPPIIESPIISQSSSSKLSDIFVVQQTGTKKLKPINRPLKEEIKKSSETLDTISSETQSYKDKLKTRFLSIKKQAEHSAIKSAKVRKQSETETQESVINSEISRHEEKRSDFFQLQQDAEDFFCKTESDVKTDRKESFCDIDFENDVVEFLPPDLIDCVSFENELFQFQRKENNIVEVRNVEDDGLYYETNDLLTKTELDILKNRLLKDDYEWFDSKGQLKLLPDPRLDKSYKPFPTKVIHSDFVTDQTNLFFVSKTQNTLEIVLEEIHFQHHGLFSEEHVIAQQLISVFDEYKTQKSWNFYRKKLEALRFAKRRLCESGDCDMKYFDDIKIIRDKMYFEALNERQLKLKILNLWKKLKQKREKQKYSSTCLKLNIHVTNVDFEQETLNWDKNIEIEIREILEENEKCYAEQLNEYRIKKQQWNNDGKSTSTYTSDLLQEKPKKPKKHFNETQIKNEVIDRFNECLKPPGEPLIEFELNYNHQITPTNEIHNTKEKLRRSLMKKSHFLLKILYRDNRLVCKTQLQSINDSFIIKFDEFISIKMYDNPDVLIIEIYEHVNPINKIKLTSVEIQVPPFSQSLSNETKPVSFENNDYTEGLKGFLMYKIGWDDVYPEQQQFPTLFNIEDLQQWLKKYPDPQDPKNVTFFDYIESIEFRGCGSGSVAEYFRFDPDALEFCTQQEIDQNLRFKLLKLRNDKDPEFRGIIVPIREKEISPEMFKQFDERKKEQKLTTDMFQTFRNETIDVQRKWATKFLAQIENHIIELSKTAERKISLTDVLNEDYVPTVGSLGSSIINWFQPKRPLRPARKHKQMVSTGVDLKDLNILVNILGAVHVPARKLIQNPEDEMNKICVRPFVTVSFRGVSGRTSVADGPNPVWNQEIILPIRNKNEPITISSLETIKETIKINVYDETVDDLIMDDRLRETNIHQQLGCNWLGSYEIPFHTLLQSARIEGTFKINLPSILLGYEQETMRAFHTMSESTTQKIDTFISIFITLQPNINKIEPLLKCVLETIESQYIEEHVTTWHDQYKLLYAKRYFSPFITTMNGEKCIITRYIHPVKLPPSVGTEEELAKYVSLIPFRESSSGLISDIWLNPQQLLTVMMGSINDHALLLIGYFLTLGLKCWLLLGYGIPHGYTSYVLVRQQQNKHFYLYDVFSGQKHTIFHQCPLQRVFCAVNAENVWANIQNDDRLHLIKFSFKKQRDWLPLFDCDISAPTCFDQIDPVYYQMDQEIEAKIERKLKKKIMDMRKHSTTTWNYHSNVEFKKILMKLQENESVEDFDIFHETHQIRGFIHNFPYTSIKDLIDFIHETGIYLNDHPEQEFSLACSTKTYCNNVVMVWLYVATLLRISV